MKRKPKTLHELPNLAVFGFFLMHTHIFPVLSFPSLDRFFVYWNKIVYAAQCFFSIFHKRTPIDTFLNHIMLTNFAIRCTASSLRDCILGLLRSFGVYWRLCRLLGRRDACEVVPWSKRPPRSVQIKKTFSQIMVNSVIFHV